MYDMDSEPGHKELAAAIVHVDLAAYQPGQPHYDRLIEAMHTAQRFSWPSNLMENV